MSLGSLAAKLSVSLRHITLRRPPMLTSSNSGNISHSLRQREHGFAAGFEENFVHDSLTRNIKGKKCLQKVIEKYNNNIITIAVRDCYAAIATRKKLSVRNLITGDTLWKLSSGTSISFQEIIKITKDKIFCCCTRKIADGPVLETSLGIFDLLTGDQDTIKDPDFENKKICVIGKRIFNIGTNGCINERNFENDNIHAHKTLSGTFLKNNPKLMASESFLVQFDDRRIHIFDRVSNEERFIKVPTLEAISAVAIVGEKLICGLTNTYRLNKQNDSHFSDCIVIDLKTGKITDKYFKKEFTLLNDLPNDFYISENYPIAKILPYKEWTFLGLHNGLVVAVNFAEKTHKVLGQHIVGIEDLIIDEEILMSVSKELEREKIKAKLILWDLKSLEKIAETRLPNLSKAFFVSGKLLAAVNNQLVQWDFFQPSSIEMDLDGNTPGVWS